MTDAKNPPSEAAEPAQTPVHFASADTTDIAYLSFEQARTELITVVSQLETGGAALEESLALWQRGEALAQRCEQWLDGAQARLAEVKTELEAE